MRWCAWFRTEPSRFRSGPLGRRASSDFSTGLPVWCAGAVPAALIPMDFFSPAQCAGYGAFALGVTAFTQSDDRWLKRLLSAQGLVYCVHFMLLGNQPAGASALLSSARSYLTLYSTSAWLAALFIAVNLAAGAVLVHSLAGWLPVVASCAGAYAMFRMRGTPMRLVLLACTAMWLTNNLLSGSIGGTLLELTIGAANGTTIIRLLRASPAAASQPMQRESDKP
jgi:hypothetical protein